MTARNQFRFQFTAGPLREASTTKAEHHRERESFHKDAGDKLESELKEKGVSLREHEVTGGKQFTPTFDPALLSAYNDHRSREASNKLKAEEYEAWGRAFNLTVDTEVFELDVDDVTYFGL